MYLHVSKDKITNLVEGKWLYYTDGVDIFTKMFTESYKQDGVNYKVYELVMGKNAFTDKVYENKDNTKILKITDANFYEIGMYAISHTRDQFMDKFAGIDGNDLNTPLSLYDNLIISKRTREKAKGRGVNILNSITDLFIAGPGEGIVWRFDRVKLRRLSKRMVDLERSESEDICEDYFTDILTTSEAWEIISEDAHSLDLKSETSRKEYIQDFIKKYGQPFLKEYEEWIDNIILSYV